LSPYLTGVPPARPFPGDYMFIPYRELANQPAEDPRSARPPRLHDDLFRKGETVRTTNRARSAIDDMAFRMVRKSGKPLSHAQAAEGIFKPPRGPKLYRMGVEKGRVGFKPAGRICRCGSLCFGRTTRKSCCGNTVALGRNKETERNLGGVA